MRSCIYCGRDLNKDEKCNCAGAENARRAKSGTQQEQQTNQSYNGWQENTYQTGYTKKKKKFSFKKPNFKRHDFKGDAYAVKGFTRRFIHDPVNTVCAPGYINPFQIVLILIITALAVSLCAFFISSRFFPGGYKIGALLQYVGVGTAVLTVLELVFIFVLYMINKLLLRQIQKFTVFAARPVAAMIPLMLFALLGAGINFFSIYATIMLLLTGCVMNSILTYEGLKSEWSFASSTKIMYLTGLSYFLFFVIAFNLLRLF